MNVRVNATRIQELMRRRGLTQAALAREASTSRARINSLLTRPGHAGVRERTLHQIARALQTSTEELTLDVKDNCYKNFLRKTYLYIDFQGFSLTQTRPLALSSVFIPLRVRVAGTEPEKGGDCNESGIAGSRDCLSKDEGALIAAESELVSCIDRYDRVYLKGEPGSGKTMCLKHIVSQYVERKAPDDPEVSRGYTPLFVPLAEYEKAMERESIRNPIEFVAAQARSDGCKGADELLKGELSHGNCIVLFDGLDEVGATEKVIASLRSFIEDFPLNKFVLTARMVGSDENPWTDNGFAVLQIEDWQGEDIKAFCAKWFSANHDHRPNKECADCAEKADRLWRSIQSNSRVTTIATNPLMLTILAMLDRATGMIPRRRVDLYSRIVGVLLETWEASRQVARPGDPLHGVLIEAKEFHWLLDSIGLEMQRKDLRLIPRWWLADFIQGYLHGMLGFTLEDSKDQADRVIRYLIGRTGLLVERGAGLFGFSHMTFQEYFASRGIIDEAAGGASYDISSRLRPYLYHPRWSEVIRLTCAQLPPGQSASLIRVILDDPDPVGRFLRRGPQLAMRCLSDGATVADRALISDLFEQQAGLGESKWIGITLGVLRALRGLKETRYESDARKMIDAILDKASGSVSEFDYISCWRAAHGPVEQFMPGNTRHWPGDEHIFRLGSRDVKMVCMGFGVRSESPEKWYKKVHSIIRSSSVEPGVRRDFIAEIGRSALSDEAVRSFLMSLVSDGRDPEMRSAAAYALRKAAVSSPEVRRLILDGFRERRTPASARQGFGRALVSSAPRHADVRESLLAVLEDGAESPEIRAAAVSGLALATGTDVRARRTLVERLRSVKTPSRLRESCAIALGEAIGLEESVNEIMIMLLDESEERKLARIANQAIAEALADGRISWDVRLVDRVETYLMDVVNPCPHALDALEDILRTREMRGGLRLDSVLQDYLRPYAERIQLSFIYGSTARLTQKRDSDIDLFLVGDVRLKDIALTLAEAEQVLGRPINPVIYSKETFLKKRNERDPFLSQVLKAEKVLLGGFDDELRAIASKWTDHAASSNGTRTSSIDVDR